MWPCTGILHDLLLLYSDSSMMLVHFTRNDLSKAVSMGKGRYSPGSRGEADGGEKRERKPFR